MPTNLPVKPKTRVQLALRALRQKMGMSQQRFSEALGVTLVTICRWETSRPPTGHTLAELARFARHIAQDAEAADVFDQAFLEDPAAQKRVRMPESIVESTLRDIQTNKADPEMRQAYIEILQAMERAYAMLVEHGLASKQGMAEHQFQAMTRFHQLLKWELESEKRAHTEYWKRIQQMSQRVDEHRKEKEQEHEGKTREEKPAQKKP
jgi:transcriptional regulator with XRE-family HTH domain